MKKKFSVFLSVWLLSAVAFAGNNDWLANSKISSEFQNYYKNAGKFNELMFDDSPEKYDEAWEKDSIDRSAFEKSFAEKCLKSGELSQALSAMTQSDVDVKSFVIVGKDISVDFGQDLLADLYFVEIRDAKNNKYYGLTEHFYTFTNGSPSAHCWAVSSPARL